MSFNQWIGTGNLTRDVETKELGNSTLAEFGVACNRKWKTSGGEEREDVLFLDCKAWGRTGEVIAQYFSKGKPIMLVGRLATESWEAKDGGGKRSKNVLIVERFEFIGGKREDDGGAERPQRREPGNKASLKGPPAEKPYSDDDQQFKDDDIPF